MNALEIREACACLIMLERDVEWWEEQGLSRVRPTLRDGWKALQQLQEENKLLHARVNLLETCIDALTGHGNAEAAAKAWEGVEAADAWLANLRATAERGEKEVQA